jgi:hypothetical protein
MNRNLFERVEIKYLLNPSGLQWIRQGFYGRLRQDAYGESAVCSVYYDTADYRIIRQSLAKPAYKEKMRLRSYGTPQSGDRVFLELKKKYRGVVTKRRAELTLKQVEPLLLAGVKPDNDPVFEELLGFARFYQPSPAAYISCLRTAFVSDEYPELRITLDRAVRGRKEMPDLRGGVWGAPLLPPDITLMEVKVPAAMPVWLCNLLSEGEIYPVSFSKYGAFYQSHILSAGNTTGGILYA